MVLADTCAAALASVHIVMGIDPSYGYLCLDVPVLAEDPAVAVTEPDAGCPSLIAVVFQIAEV